MRSRRSRAPREESSRNCDSPCAALSELRPFVLQVKLDRRDRFLAERHDALLVAFAVAEAVLLVEMDVARPHDREFRNAAAGGVEQFEHRTVASPPGSRRPRRRKQLVDFGRRQHGRHALPEFLRAEQLGLVVGQYAFQLQVAEEYLERDDVPADAGRGELLVGEPGRVVGEFGDLEAFDAPGAEPFEKSPQVAFVGDDAVFGQVAFAAQVADERFAPACRVFGGGEAAWFDFFAIGGHGR